MDVITSFCSQLASMGPDDSDVGGLLERRVDACRAKHIDQLMWLSSDDVVYYDVVAPHRLGSAQVHRNFLRWFHECDGPIGLATHDLEVAASAAADSRTCSTSTAGSASTEYGVSGAIRLRATVCCRRTASG